MPASRDLSDLTKIVVPTGNNWDNEVEDDLEGEQETMPDLSDQVEPPSQLKRKADEMDDDNEKAQRLKSSVAKLSKGVTEKTHDEYIRLGKNCVEFLIKQEYIRGTDNDNFFTSTPLQDTPQFIVAWINSKCDEIDLEGKTRPRSFVRDTYSHAEKMRASMSYMFGRQCGLGSLPWNKSEVTGNWIGNPSVSHIVSSYMLSLRRRKVQAGDTPTSSRAITSDIIRRLWNYNTGPVGSIRNYTAGTRSHNSIDVDIWGFGRARRLLHCAYSIAYLCMLRFDEVLKIRFEDIKFHNQDHIEITLPWRKTHQCGEIKPFPLFTLPQEEAHLCPVRALAHWIHVSRLTTGYVFRKIFSGDRVSTDNKPLAADTFLEMFRNNLLDINIDPISYGTHSFRRGGCQYFASVRRWPLRRICEWGGWSLDFTSLTIVKYLISWNDDPTECREDFFNPKKRPAVKCPTCGRCCPCS